MDNELIDNLLPSEPIDETSNLIYQARGLTEKDRKLAEKILDFNLQDFKKRKENIFFKEKEETEFIDKIEYSIKAILQHEVSKRV